MNQTTNPHDADLWDNDPLSQCVSEHVQKMPDRPKVVIAIINQNREQDEVIARNMGEFKEAFLRLLPLKVFNIPYTVFLFGFEQDSPVQSGRLLEVLAMLPTYEGAIYVDGRARLRLAPTKQRG